MYYSIFFFYFKEDESENEDIFGLLNKATKKAEPKVRFDFDQVYQLTVKRYFE
jgi:hypothetical protein